MNKELYVYFFKLISSKGGLSLLGVDNLLLNFLFILISIFFYYFFGIHRKINPKFVIGMLCVIAVGFCMTFPITILSGYIYDLRIIPFLISIVYGGPLTGCITAIFLVTYRFMIGGDGFEATLLSYMPIFCVSILLRYALKSVFFKRKVIAYTVLALCSAIFVSIISMLTIHQVNKLDYISFYIYYCCLITLSMWISVFIIETMNENIKMRSEIIRSENLQVIGELTASIAHEIRNPITVAKGFAQLIDKKASYESFQQYSKYIISELDRAEAIISDYLTYTKPHAKPLKRINVRDVLIKTISLMEPLTIIQKHQIKHQFEGEMYIYGDEIKLTQVFVNIFKNAFEAMNKNGIINIQARSDGEHVIIEVIDTGIGMTNEQLQKIGNPFFTTKATGTGLGLMVSYRIIESLHGTIKVESEKDRGTRFTIVLPCAKEID